MESKSCECSIRTFNHQPTHFSRDAQPGSTPPQPVKQFVNPTQQPVEASCVNLNYSHLAPASQRIAARLVQVCQVTTEKRKRDMIERQLAIFIQKAPTLQ